MTSRKVETAERPLIPPTATPALRRFWADFQARTAAVYASLHPVPLRDRKTSAPRGGGNVSQVASDAL
jgi:hypothetical protein